jgi:hypothetical protein
MLQQHISDVLTDTVVAGKVATQVMSARYKLIAERNVYYYKNVFIDGIFSASCCKRSYIAVRRY